MRARRLALISVMAVGAASLSITTTAHADQEPVLPAPAPVFEDNASGEAAIEQLGDDLPEVAESVGLSASELEHEFLDDSDLHVDRTGQLMFVDTVLLDEAPPSGADPPVGQGAFPYLETFTLHSKPDSKRVIYLDFDGHAVTGTAWNTSYNSGNDFTASPFDSDGTPGSFSDAEKDVVQYVWQSIAEDYSSFDVDVTTEEPSQDKITRTDAGDDEYGTRLVISNTDTIGSTCSCGGIAYVGVFDNVSGHAAYQPAFVFTRSSKSAKFIAEAGSHEVGHNLGLSHDGVTGGAEYYSGHADWAPIMGVGYSKGIVQWSKGEYSKASNKQDDVTVVGSNGLAERTDEAGSKPALATYIGDSFPITQSGVISNRKDIDLFRFNAGAGEITVTAAADSISANLDIELQLLTAKGKKVAKANPVDDMSASITATVVEGTYYVRIDGAKNGSSSKGYSDYASLGQYTITITGSDPSGAAPNVVPKAKITSASRTIGVPGPVTFTNEGSYDPDGDLASTTWDFGDESDAGSGASVTHTYTTEGAYTVSMTVADAAGGEATKTLKIKAVPALTVSEITSGSITSGSKTYAAVTVKVVDAAGDPVEGARVAMKWTGSKRGAGSGKTASDGTAQIKGPLLTSGAAFTATVSKVTMKNMAYNAELGSSVISLDQSF